MNQITNSQRAAFSFLEYEITSFAFTKPTLVSDDISIDFEPSGKFNPEKSTVELSLSFKAFMRDGEKFQQIVSADTKSTFKFEGVNSVQDIPEYFYKNSLAIVYPYIRAFVSTLTFQANWKPAMLLPLLNLSDLSEPLKASMTA